MRDSPSDWGVTPEERIANASKPMQFYILC